MLIACIINMVLYSNTLLFPSFIEDYSLQKIDYHMSYICLTIYKNRSNTCLAGDYPLVSCHVLISTQHAQCLWHYCTVLHGTCCMFPWHTCLHCLTCDSFRCSIWNYVCLFIGPNVHRDCLFKIAITSHNCLTCDFCYAMPLFTVVARLQINL